MAYLVEYGRELAEQNAWNFLWLIDAQEAFHVHGGSDLIPRRLFERLQSPVALGHQLVSVVEGGDGAFLLTCRPSSAASSASWAWAPAPS